VCALRRRRSFYLLPGDGECVVLVARVLLPVVGRALHCAPSYTLICIPTRMRRYKVIASEIFEEKNLRLPRLMIFHCVTHSKLSGMGSRKHLSWKLCCAATPRNAARCIPLSCVTRPDTFSCLFFIRAQ
jgi:hypothetical protein